jgi:hypothetical protein
VTAFKYDIVEKFCWNVVADTVGPAALAVLVLTIGNARAVKEPAKAIAARALLFLTLIFSPTLKWHPNDAKFRDYYMNVR